MDDCGAGNNKNIYFQDCKPGGFCPFVRRDQLRYSIFGNMFFNTLHLNGRAPTDADSVKKKEKKFNIPAKESDKSKMLGGISGNVVLVVLFTNSCQIHVYCISTASVHDE